jgi:hypothetical protein
MDRPFSYTKDQTKVLYQALKNAGLKRDADWPRYTESNPVTVRIRDKDYLIVFTPV